MLQRKTNTISTRSHPSLSPNSLLSRLLDYRRDYVESDVGCGGKRGQGRVNTPLMIRQVWTETSCTLNDAHTHTYSTFRDFKFVVLLVPQAARIAIGDAHRKLSVWAVRGLQGEVGG